MANTDEILETFGWNINELMRYFPPFNSFMNNPRVLRANFFPWFMFHAHRYISSFYLFITSNATKKLSLGFKTKL